MTSAHEKLLGFRYKTICQYYAETRSGFSKQLPLGTTLRDARKAAQAFANEKDEVVHLLVRSGYGSTRYVSGKDLYEPTREVQ